MDCVQSLLAVLVNLFINALKHQKNKKYLLNMRASYEILVKPELEETSVGYVKVLDQQLFSASVALRNTGLPESVVSHMMDLSNGPTGEYEIHTLMSTFEKMMAAMIEIESNLFLTPERLYDAEIACKESSVPITPRSLLVHAVKAANEASWHAFTDYEVVIDDTAFWKLSDAVITPEDKRLGLNNMLHRALRVRVKSKPANRLLYFCEAST